MADSESGEEDPQAVLAYELNREKMRHVQEQTKDKVCKVRRVVVGQKLPSQSSALCRSVRNFVKFMMGTPATIGAFPHSPTQEELNTWHHRTNSRYEKVVDHLAQFSKTHKEVPKALFKKMYSDEVSRIRKHLSPPAFNPAQDVVNSEINVPINVKKACELEVQLAGFGRVTLEWHSRSFSCSPWNGTMGSILMKNY